MFWIFTSAPFLTRDSAMSNLQNRDALCSGVSLAVKGIYIRTVVDEQLRGLKISMVCGDMKWSQVVNVPDIHVCTMADEQSRDVEIFTAQSFMEWCSVVPVPDIRTALDQKFYDVKFSKP